MVGNKEPPVGKVSDMEGNRAVWCREGASSFCGPRVPQKAERDGVVVRLWEEEVSHSH